MQALPHEIFRVVEIRDGWQHVERQVVNVRRIPNDIPNEEPEDERQP